MISVGRMLRINRLALAVTLLAWCANGSAPLAQQPQPPAFRAAVDAVRLDVRVVDGNGAFVGDLTRDDLRVFEDGAEQSITAFSKIELPPPVTTVAAGPPADVSSNTSFHDGRVYLLLLDDLQIHPLPEVTVRQLARRFIERYTGPADRVAIATTSGIGSGTQDFTNNRAHLFDAVEQFKARALPESVAGDFPGLAAARAAGPADPPPSTNLPTQVLPLQWLLTSVEWLGTVPDRRKALVFISEGVLDRSIDPGVESAHLEIRSAAARANVAIYSVDPIGLPSAPSGAVKPVVVASDDPISERRRRLRSGLTRLADETGGAFVSASNGFDALFEQVVADSSAYYLIGYTSTHSQSRKFREVNVRVARPGLKAQVRRGYGAGSAVAAKRAAPPKGLPTALGEAFQSAVPITGIELAVTAAPRRGKGDRASVAVFVEAHGPRPLDLFIGAADAGGKMQAFQRGTVKPGAAKDTAAAMQATARFDLKPGRYHLRVAALEQNTGALGSVQHDFEVPDFSKEELSISGIALVDLQRGPTPTTRRSFGTLESIDVAAEVYWQRGMTQPISVMLMVTGESGAIVYRQEGVIDPSQRPRLGVDFGATLKPERWTPGQYRLTIEARTAGAKGLSVKRELPLVISAQ